VVEYHGFPLTKLMAVNTGLARLRRLRFAEKKFIDVEAIESLRNRLQPSVAAAGEHSEHCLNTE